MQVTDRMTTHLRSTLRSAMTIATRQGFALVYPEHLLLGLLTTRGSIGCELLRKHEADRKAVLTAALRHRKHKIKKEIPAFSKDARHCIERAFFLASQHNHVSIGTEHLLLAMLENPNPAVADAVKKLHLDVKELIAYLHMVLRSTSKFQEITATLLSNTHNITPSEHSHANDANMLGAPDMMIPKKKRALQTLEQYGRELTSTKTQATLDPVIGRDAEVERMIQLLCRKTKNNPLLVGDPGVGKTAIVEGLAQRIVQHRIPPILEHKRIFSLDLSLMIAGTVYRGEFESRIKQLIEEVRSNPDIILFIDEMHTIVGAGATSGSLDAANIIKPALARGELRCIGATTYQEYKKHIEPDPAFDRRFGKIIIDEPSIDATRDILQGLKSAYEEYHNVRITDEAIAAAIEGAARHIPEFFFPDKAIDLIDEASAAAATQHPRNPAIAKLAEITQALSVIDAQKKEAVTQEDYERALHLKSDEEDLLAHRDTLTTRSKMRGAARTINSSDILRVLTTRTGSPVAMDSMHLPTRMHTIRTTLTDNIIGQEAARTHIMHTLEKGILGLQTRKRPLAVLLFIGPSGTGKTHTAKSIAQAVYGDEKHLITIDMSEYRESYSISKLLGAPAGYIGYREQTSLTDRIRRAPHSVLLFDEIDKAHPDVHNLFLQMVDEGAITDATGRRIDLSRSIIVMTAAAGSEMSASPLGFGTTAAANTTADASFHHRLKDVFRSEFLYRLDAIVPFVPLTRDDLRAIATRELTKYKERMAHLGFTLTLEESVLDWIADRAIHSPQMGRTVYTIIESEIIPMLTSRMLEGTASNDLHVTRAENTLSLR
jgi:ATP-dependent Clp protease ATP-binding subunit ClpC